MKYHTAAAWLYTAISRIEHDGSPQTTVGYLYNAINLGGKDYADRILKATNKYISGNPELSNAGLQELKKIYAEMIEGG